MVGDSLKRTWKEMAVAYFKIKSKTLPGRWQKTRNISVKTVSELSIESSSSCTRSKNDYLSSYTFGPFLHVT
jgi:hypothetical protein